MEIAENAAVFFRTNLLQRRSLLTVQHSEIEPARVTVPFLLKNTHALLCRITELLRHLIAAEERIRRWQNRDASAAGNTIAAWDVFFHQRLHEELRIRYRDLGRTDKGHIIAAEYERAHRQESLPVFHVQCQITAVRIVFLLDFLEQLRKGGNRRLTDGQRHILALRQGVTIRKLLTHVVAIDVDNRNVILRLALAKFANLHREAKPAKNDAALSVGSTLLSLRQSSASAGASCPSDLRSASSFASTSAEKKRFSSRS